MSLAEVPLLLALVGLAAYVVLGGADFGAGLWYMLLPGERRRPLRDLTYHAMGPVWEANHVWLIFVLVVVWTAYPGAFGAIFSTLYMPLFAAALGIILRGTCYALRGAVTGPTEERVFGALFGISSLLTPFALGAAIGGIASGRVPEGNAAGDAVDSWLNPTSVLVGALAVATSAYLAAVWLSGDAARGGRDELVGPLRRRALAAGAIAGAVALGGLVVIHADAERIYDGLTSGAGLAGLLGSAAAGAATMALVARGRLEPARWSAAVAVGAIVAGWALAQRPQLLPGLTVEQAAAGHATLVALLATMALGAVILIPSLVLLFGLVLRGRFDERPDEPGSLQRAGGTPAAPGPQAPEPGPAAGIVAAACAALGAPLTVLSEAGVGLAAGVVLLLAAIAAAAVFLVPRVTLGDEGDGEVSPPRRRASSP
jgi:cytochrome d ubiquinol oxidase subunit II